MRLKLFWSTHIKNILIKNAVNALMFSKDSALLDTLTVLHVLDTVSDYSWSPAERIFDLS